MSYARCCQTLCEHPDHEWLASRWAAEHVTAAPLPAAVTDEEVPSPGTSSEGLL